MKYLSISGVLLAGLLWSACERASGPGPGNSAFQTDPPSATNAEASAAPRPKFFVARGVVKQVDLEGKKVTVQHEKIADYMDAMTMPFRVKDPKQLQNLQPGDTIAFVLFVTPDESWIDKIQKQKPDNATGQAPVNAAPERPAFRIARDVAPLNIGDLMPDYQFTNDLGRALKLSDFKGQALAFTFIFTRCPLPDFCPRMSRNFSEVYQKLMAMPNAPTNWHLLTISFDPHFDTPAVLHGYALAFQNDPQRWNFVTGAMIDIDAITDQFNLTVLKQGANWEHKIRTVVVNADGRIQNIIYGNEWKPDALVEEIVKAAKSSNPPSA